MTDEKKPEEVIEEIQQEGEKTEEIEKPEEQENSKETLEKEEEKNEEPSSLKDKLFGKNKKLEELQKKHDELNDKYLRVNAEYQNYRRRTEKEKSEIYTTANAELAVQLLEIKDNFERALEAKTEDEAYKTGVEGIYKQLQAVLEKNNVKEIEALKKPFDPKFHNAVMTVEPTEEIESGTVAAVFQKGYTMGNKILRPAMVSVAQ